MIDEPSPKPAPLPAPAVDEGLTAWATLVHGHLTGTPGVEIIEKQGGSVHFRFRGQTFMVNVHRIA